MKGYTNVSVVDINSAMTNWEEQYDGGADMLDLGVALYYAKHYTNGSRWTKFFNKKKTPTEFVRKQIPMFETWSYVLKEVLTEEQVKLLDMWNWSRHKEQYVAVKSLLNAAESGDILLDNELCWFVNKYKGEKDV